MKKQTAITFSQISKETTEKLNKVVNETLAVEFSQSKIFITVDLWNIQRKSRTLLNRRHCA